jgi:hypothetical protein
MYTLIIYIFAGMLANGDSVAITNVPGFQTQSACEAAGKQTQSFVKGSAKEHRYVCVKL